MDYVTMLASALGLFLGAGITYLVIKNRFQKRDLDIRNTKIRVQREAENQADNLLREAKLEAKTRLLEMKSEFDAETEETKQELKKEDRRLSKRTEKIDKQEELALEREQEIANKEKEITVKFESASKKESKYAILLNQIKKELERVSGMTSEEAKETLLKTMKEDAKLESAKFIKKFISEAKEQADKEAKKILCTAIQRYAGDYVAERTVSVVNLPGDEMKGRIIGREGRNIRAIEAATGIDLIIDDTPEAVILSGFNPVRREVARLSLEKLISDGRIHPARIEDMVERVTKEVDGTIKEAGEQAAFDLGVHGIDPELIKILGKLKFRTSYAQNVLQHSIEVAFLCGTIAAELGLNIKLAKRMGLLHDIGKAVDYEVDGAHAIIGSNLAKKYGEEQNIVNAIAAHHEDKMPESVYDYIVQAADALSGARPGARKESLENYVKRLEDLEKIANSFEGVTNTYAIQAGREVRVIVESDKISDDRALIMSKEIAEQIDENVTFPGQVKVVVIRETRAVEYTK
jgi:ribonuclease Y